MIGLVTQFTSELADTVAEAKRGDPWRPITVVLPTRLAVLQWRRRVARQLQGVFNVRWTDLGALANEVAIASGQVRQIATRPTQIAAAWVALSTGPTVFQRYSQDPGLLRRVLGTFQILDLLDHDAYMALSAEVRELHAIFRCQLEGFDSGRSRIELAISLADTIGELILVQGRPTDPMLRDLEARVQAVRRIRVPQASHHSEHWSVNDELDEVHLAGAWIQEAAVSPWDIAVVVPDADPYSRFIEHVFEDYGIPWNGLRPEKLKDTQAGRALRRTMESKFAESWESISSEFESQLRLISPDSEGYQVVRDSVDAWWGAKEFVSEPTPALLAALRDETLETTLASENRFGDGVFVGTPHQLDGLAFRMAIAVGFRDKKFPRPRGIMPFLPRGFGELDARGQRERLEGFFNAQEEVRYVSSRSDRRNGREAFPSPWIQDLPNRTVPSSLALMQLIGPRSEREARTAQAFTSGVLLDEYRQRSFERRRDGDRDWETLEGQDLMPAEGLSPSQIETFFDCPRKWYLRYGKQLREVPEVNAHGWTRADLGASVHESLKWLFNSYHLELGNPEFPWKSSHAEELARHLRARLIVSLDHEPTRSELNEISRWETRLRRLLEFDSSYRASTRSTPVWTELPVAGQIDGVNIRGRSDRVDQSESGFSIIDYKTGARPNFGSSGDPTERGRRIQGLIYAELLRPTLSTLVTERLVTSYWYLGETPSKISVDIEVNEEALQLMRSRVLLAGEMIHEGCVPMSPRRASNRMLCGDCSYRTICPADREAIVRRQTDRSTGRLREFFELQNLGSRADGAEGELDEARIFESGGAAD